MVVETTTSGAHTRRRRLVGLLFTVWCAHLLSYVWLVPPWQHYDEPTHFEYAALIRELGRLPTIDEQIPEVRRAIARSMIDSGFYDQRSLALPAPDVNAADLSLGVNERGHPPLYYVLVALGTLPVRDAPVVVQLYAARCVSVLLALLLFGAANRLLQAVTGEDWEARWLALAALALQPAFVDSMSAVNNDALANLVAVALLLVAVRTAQRPGWPALLLGLAAVALALNVKRTLLIYSLVVPLAWLLALPPKLRRRVFGGLAALAVAGLAWLLLQPWSIADWRGEDDRPAPVTMRSGAPRDGRHAFALNTAPGQPPARLSQSLYRLRLPDVAGNTVTLGAWMRASQAGVEALSPVLLLDGRPISRSLTLGTEWQQVTLSAPVPPDVRELSVELRGAATPGVVLYDSLALAAGGPDQLPPDGAPDGSFEPGLLGPGEPRNLLRNAGAERRVPTLAPPAALARGGMLDDKGMQQTLSSLFHPAWIAAVYPRQALMLFQGAWGRFGWGQIGVGAGWFTPLALLVGASLLGLALQVRRWRQDRQSLGWALCAAAVALGWGAALLRVHAQPFPGAMFWSFGRYTFVAIVPSLLLFVVGLRAVFPATLRRQGMAAVVAFLVCFALAALSGFLAPALDAS